MRRATLNLADQKLTDGDTGIVVDGLNERDVVDSGEDGVSKSGRKHGRDVSASIFYADIGRCIKTTLYGNSKD